MPKAKETLVQNLHFIDSRIRSASRRHSLSEDDAKELRSFILLKLVERDYRIIRGFSGEGKFFCYLSVAIRRLALDFLNHRFGKWRPSAAARRMGPQAVNLERLICRDRLTTEEAIALLEGNDGPGSSGERLRDLVARLPLQPRPRVQELADLDALDRTADTEASFLQSEKIGAAKKLGQDLQAAITALDPEDRLMLELRFRQSRTAGHVAERIGCQRRKVYSRLDCCFRKLRQRLSVDGWTSQNLACLPLVLTAEITIEFTA